jgi:hypothetical protein
MKNRTPVPPLAAGLFFAGAFSLIGCLPEPTETAGKGTAAPLPGDVPGIQGTRLYVKELGAGHHIEFYDFGEGHTAVHESKSMDDKQTAVLDVPYLYGSLADVYAKLNPGAEAVPEAILKADEDAALQRAAVRVNTAEFLSPRAAGEDGNKPMALAKTAESCSQDGYGDGWGGDWFLNQFCTTGNFRYCQKNFGWATSGEYSASWSSWRQMEGDFNVRGHMTGSIIRVNWFWGESPRTGLFDYDVLPRHYEIWTFTDGKDRYSIKGTSPCGHLHVAFLWN